MEKIGRSVRCVGGRGRGINVGYLRLGALSNGGCWQRVVVGRGIGK